VRLPGHAKLLDSFENLAVLSQVPLNLPHMAANSLFFRGSSSETEVSELPCCPPMQPGCEAATGVRDRGRSDSGVPESPVFLPEGFATQIPLAKKGARILQVKILTKKRLTERL
jgi:hypothetical protein